MPGLVPGIHVFCLTKQAVDGRDKPGHDREHDIKKSLYIDCGAGGGLL
jgi:hypothetical protein